MPAKLKVYRTHNGVSELIVAAPNQREAARLFGTSVHDLRKYGGIYKGDGAHLAFIHTGTVLKRPILASNGSPWTLVRRNP